MSKKKRDKPYLQWSKRQSGVVIAFYIVYYLFLAGCIVYEPESAEWLVRLAMYVMIVMVANLGFYNGNSVLEKINGNKLLDGLAKGGGGDDSDDDDDDEDGEVNEDEETLG